MAWFDLKQLILRTPHSASSEFDTYRPDNDCEVLDRSPFDRVTVDYKTLGGARITWTLDKDFSDSGTYTYGLQFDRGDNNWTLIGSSVPDAAWLEDPEQRVYGARDDLRYRIILNTGEGIYRSMPAVPEQYLSFRDWHIYKELLRKEKLRHDNDTSLEGVLVKKRRYGTKCPCTDPITNEVRKAHCTVCYGNKIAGGFHAAIFCNLADTSTEGWRTERMDPRGTVADTIISGRILGNFPVDTYDMWVQRAGDVRYLIDTVKQGEHLRGITISYSVKLLRQPRNSILYQYPINWD